MCVQERESGLRTELTECETENRGTACGKKSKGKCVGKSF